MHIAAIATMRDGLEHFVYRELCFFADRGCRISLFPTKYRPGLYGPRSEWRLLRWRPLAVLLSQPACCLRSPLRYAALLGEALAMGAVIELFLAWHFSRHMAAADVIYATFGDRKLFVGYFCKRILGRPLAVTIHAYELYQNPNPRLFVRALGAADQIIAVTEHNREYLAAHFGIARERVEVVRLCVDLEEYRPARPFVILIVAAFVEKKGHEVLFEAVRRLGRPDLTVWVVGGMAGEPRVDVPRLAEAKGIASQVAFFGKLRGAALRAVYHACDVFCLPSRVDSLGQAEGFPTVLIEAMAMGKPVITTRHVEIPRLVPEILVAENDAEGLARAIEAVYQSVDLRQRLGAQNRDLAAAHFSPRNTASTVTLLQGLATRSAASRPLPAFGRPREQAGEG